MFYILMYGLVKSVYDLHIIVDFTYDIRRYGMGANKGAVLGGHTETGFGEFLPSFLRGTSREVIATKPY